MPYTLDELRNRQTNPAPKSPENNTYDTRKAANLFLDGQKKPNTSSLTEKLSLTTKGKKMDIDDTLENIKRIALTAFTIILELTLVVAIIALVGKGISLLFAL